MGRGVGGCRGTDPPLGAGRGAVAARDVPELRAELHWVGAARRPRPRLRAVCGDHDGARGGARAGRTAPGPRGLRRHDHGGRPGLFQAGWWALPATLPGSVHNPGAQLEKTERLVARAQQQGARLLAGGRRNAALPRGFFFQPTLLVDVTPTMEIANDEVRKETRSAGAMLPVQWSLVRAHFNRNERR